MAAGNGEAAGVAAAEGKGKGVVPAAEAVEKMGQGAMLVSEAAEKAVSEAVEKAVSQAVEKVVSSAAEKVLAGAEEREKESGRMIHLRSSDGKSYDVTEASARLSKFIAKMIDENCADPYVPLPNVDYKTLVMVIQYCDKHAADTDEKDLKAWDNGFVNELDKDKDSLFDVITASNYLNIDGLLDLTCKKVADTIKGKTPEEIREAYNIVNDLSRDEEEEIRRENAWAFE